MACALLSLIEICHNVAPRFPTQRMLLSEDGVKKMLRLKSREKPDIIDIGGGGGSGVIGLDLYWTEWYPDGFWMDWISNPKCH